MLLKKKMEKLQNVNKLHLKVVRLNPTINGLYKKIQLTLFFDVTFERGWVGKIFG